MRIPTAPRPRPTWLRLLPFLALLACGCSSFESAWRSPALVHPPENGDPFEGRWKGSWKSVPSGHSGGLRCIVTKLDERTYRAQFKASWALLLKFGYTADMAVERRGNAAHFTGAADLGKWAGGVYHYDGHADGSELHCEYKTGSDHGYFKMVRPK